MNNKIEDYGISDNVVLNYASWSRWESPAMLTKEMRSDGRTTSQRQYIRTRIKQVKLNGDLDKFMKQRQQEQ